MAPMKIVGLLAFAIAACGPAGEPVPHFPGVTWEGASDGTTVACALSFAIPAIAQDTEWSQAEIVRHLTPLEIQVADSECVYDAEGDCNSGMEWDASIRTADPGTIEVNKWLLATAHEIRHLLAFRLTGDGQPTHIDSMTERKWSPGFEGIYRDNIEWQCGIIVP